MFMRLTGKISMRFFAAAIISLSWFLTFQPGSSAKDQNMNVIAHASSGPLVCEIRRIGAGESVQLSGVLSSASAAAGTFRFLLKKNRSIRKFERQPGQRVQSRRRGRGSCRQYDNQSSAGRSSHGGIERHIEGRSRLSRHGGSRYRTLG
jgi:hypothetical protein